jgi:hypothetical protein
MRTYLYFVIFSFFSLPLLAQEVDSRPFFVASVGASTAQDAQQLSDSDDRALLIGAGWDFSDHLATEFNYVDLGTVVYNAADTDGHAQTFTASLIPYIQFDKIRLFGRAGAGLWATEKTALTTSKAKGIDPILGAGIEYKLGRAITSWSLRLDWTRHFSVGDGTETAQSDIDTFLVGLVFRH